jgi:hypothetical protein
VTKSSTNDRQAYCEIDRVALVARRTTDYCVVATDEAERNAAKSVHCTLCGPLRELFARGGLLEAFAIHPSRAQAIAKLTRMVR